MDVWITKDGMVLTFIEARNNQAIIRKNSLSFQKPSGEGHLKGQRVILKFLHQNSEIHHTGKLKLQSYHNYFLGNDPQKHKSQIALYREIVMKEIYQGIDIRYYFDRGFLRFDFIVHAGANLDQICFTLEGHDKLVFVNNQITFSTILGECSINDLRSYQEEETISSKFVKENNLFFIKTGPYDKTRTLIIDPVIFSAYVGGSGYDESYDIAVDEMKNVYITGQTCSPNYDITPGVFQINSQDDANAFVTKFNSTGTEMIFSTYIGGSKCESAYGLCVDADHNIFIVGETSSEDFPSTSHAFQNNLTGNINLFMVKLNMLGNSLIYSTFTGGTGNDIATDLAIDNKYNVYVTGFTFSDNFPITENAFQQTNDGGSDVFVIRFSAHEMKMDFSTLLGGCADDIPNGIAIDNNRFIYITGITFSHDFDITTNTFQTSYGGMMDGFITKIDPTGSQLIYSTYVGSENDDYAKKIATDEEGNAYVVGYTYSVDFPTTSSTIQPTYDGNGDAFILKLNPEGNFLIFSTLLGGNGFECAQDIALDKSKNIVITGMTSSTDFPTLGDTIQLIFGGGYCDAFLSMINSSGSLIIYSTFIGGSDDEWCHALAIDNNNEIYVTGFTYSEDFSLPENSFHSLYSGNGDVFVIKYTTIDLLPVVYLNIHAYWDNQTGVIEWVTATENNNQGFFIERMIDGKFTEIGFVQGSGNSREIRTYHFFDKDLLNSNENIFIYRLKQIDYNGNYFLSIPFYLNKQNDVTCSKDDFQTCFLFPCPVPSKSDLSLVFNVLAETKVNIKLYSINGISIFEKTVHASEGMNEFKLYLDHIPAGNYFVVLQSTSKHRTLPLIVLSDK
ncbi:MAG: SBBP repeat-containing protein [Bacteroidales bacterium]|nr:SBBP repeat-containing protein [Bacteroidales bacterium]